jgi:hypothetical protein
VTIAQAFSDWWQARFAGEDHPSLPFIVEAFEAGWRRARSKPQPITDAQKTGERFLVWSKRHTRWFAAVWETESNSWSEGLSPLGGSRSIMGEITHYLPPPPDVKT